MKMYCESTVSKTHARIGGICSSSIFPHMFLMPGMWAMPTTPTATVGSDNKRIIEYKFELNETKLYENRVNSSNEPPVGIEKLQADWRLYVKYVSRSSMNTFPSSGKFVSISLKSDSNTSFCLHFSTSSGLKIKNIKLITLKSKLE